MTEQAGESRVMLGLFGLILVVGVGAGGWILYEHETAGPKSGQVSPEAPVANAGETPGKSVAKQSAAPERVASREEDLSSLVFWRALSRGQDDSSEVVRILGDRAWSQNELDEALWQAAKMGATNSAMILMFKGANPDADLISTPLTIACRNGQKDAVSFMLSYSKNLVDPLHSAAGSGHTDIVLMILARGIDVDSRCSLIGRTALHYASNSGKYETVVLLLERGATVNVQDRFGYTPTDLADGRGHTSVSRLLWSRGGRPLKQGQ